MKATKILFFIGLIAGICTWIACVADKEIIQYVFGFISLVAFAISDMVDKRNRDRYVH